MNLTSELFKGDDAFWVVWCPEGGAPTVVHPDPHQALAEAKRLAGINAGKRFFVLQATQCAVRDDPVSVIDLSEIPF